MSEQPDFDSEVTHVAHIAFRVGSRNAVVPVIFPDERAWWDYMTTGHLDPGIQKMVDKQIVRFRSQHSEPPA